MIYDARKAVQNGQTLEFDICIVGAGAAGITLALSFIKSGLKVGVFEGSGETPPTQDELDLYNGEVGGKPYPLIGSRLINPATKYI